MRSSQNVVSSLLVLYVLVSPSRADDWPQWRGVDRTGVSTEAELLVTWPAEGPTRLWVFSEAGAGYSGFAVAGDKLFFMGTRDEQTVLFALDATTGQEIWAAPTGKVLSNGWGDGPRGTPTVDGELVYALSGIGDLVCAKTDSGEIVWQKTMADFGGRKPKWGYAESVLIDGEKLICTPGDDQGALLALDKRTGETLWQAADVVDWAQYSSVMPVEVNGVRQYVQLFMKRVVGVAADTGQLLWEVPFDGQTAVVPTPVISDGMVYVCAGYGVGCKLIAVDSDGAQELYANKVMKNHHGGVIFLDGKLFGYSNGVGWVCQDFASGEVIWKDRKSLGKGAMTCAGGQLYCISERDGTVCLIDATDQGWQERGRFDISPQSENRSPRGAIWTHPVVSNGRLYLRDQEHVLCYDVGT